MIFSWIFGAFFKIWHTSRPTDLPGPPRPIMGSLKLFGSSFGAAMPGSQHVTCKVAKSRLFTHISPSQPAVHAFFGTESSRPKSIKEQGIKIFGQKQLKCWNEHNTMWCDVACRCLAGMCRIFRSWPPFWHKNAVVEDIQKLWFGSLQVRWLLNLYFDVIKIYAELWPTFDFYVVA